MIFTCGQSGNYFCIIMNILSRFFLIEAKILFDIILCSDTTKNVLIASTFVHLKCNKFAKYASDLPIMCPRILLSGPAGRSNMSYVFQLCFPFYFRLCFLFIKLMPFITIFQVQIYIRRH